MESKANNIDNGLEISSSNYLKQGGFDTYLSRDNGDINNLSTGAMAGANVPYLKKLLAQRNPIPSDYNKFNQAYFSYGTTTLTMASAGRIVVTGIDATAFFQVGDKLHIKQAGVSTYYYVLRTSTAYLDINGGTANILQNAKIDLIESSRVGAPSGFTGALRFNPAITSFLGVYSNSDPVNTESTYFAMTGKLVTLYISVINGAVSVASGLSLKVPVNQDGYYRGINIVVGPSTGWWETGDPPVGTGLNIWGNLTTWKFATGVGNTNFALQLTYNALS